MGVYRLPLWYHQRGSSKHSWRWFTSSWWSCTSFELCAFRYMLNFVCTAIIVRLSPRIERDSIPFLAIYIVSDLCENITFYVSLKYISITTTLCLKQLILTVVALVIDFIMTRTCNVAHMASACMCLVGTLMLTQPRFIFGSLLSRDMISAEGRLTRCVSRARQDLSQRDSGNPISTITLHQEWTTVHFGYRDARRSI